MIGYTYRPKTRVWIVFLLPGVLVFSFSMFAPIVVTGVISLHEWRGAATFSYLGLENYVRLLGDEDFWQSFVRNLVLIGYTVSGQLLVGFVAAMLISSQFLRFTEFFRTVLFVPVILSSVVVGFLWLMIYNSYSGFLNVILRGLGLEHLIRAWLEDPAIVMRSISVVKIWQYFGLHMVVMLAAIQGIPKDVMETAEIDGAGGFRRSVSIVLPLIFPTLKVLAMIAIAGNMKEFDHVYVLTGGGPGKSSMVVSIYAYFTSIVKSDLGYGAAVAVGILVLSFALVALTRIGARGGRYQ